MSTPSIVTRFAPSPTGFLHIGGARTALFNWAFARRHGGKFILRIEDTDQARSSVDSTRRILEELIWLGLDWDEGPDPAAISGDPYAAQKGPHGSYFQSQRLELYRQHVDSLLDQGRAYKCFKTPQQLQEERDRAKREKRPYKYDPTEALNRTSSEIAQLEAEGRPSVVRFKMPDSDITVPDQVLGDVTLRASELEDFIIVKSDGFPTFHLANVVDDALMGITHVLRGQEHLMNTPKHVALQQALGFASPVYAHMPLIFNADGSKMSKRDKAKAARQAAVAWKAKQGGDPSALIESSGLDPAKVTEFLDKKSDDQQVAIGLAQTLGISLPEIDVHDFRASGYLPEVILNYIALLGWSPGNDVEKFGPDPLAFLAQNFDLERIGKANARFDREKLRAFNTDAIAELDSETFKNRLHEHGLLFYPQMMRGLGDRFDRFAAAYRERSRTLDEPFINGEFFVKADQTIRYDPKAVKKVLIKNDGQGLEVLGQLRGVLAATGVWTCEALEEAIEQYARQTSHSMGQVSQPLRVAVSGGAVSPPIFDTLTILGQPSTLARIDFCIRTVKEDVLNCSTK